jgi:teichuronic acid biosynthesis glycosyltransferase TuaC
LRALVLSNMLPDAGHPERGRFVRDQVAALRELEGLEVYVHEFAPGPKELAGAAFELRRRFGGRILDGRRHPHQGSQPHFDVVHAHFGLTAWPALAVPARVRALTVHGTDVRHPRTRLATAAVLPLIDVLGAASAPLADELPSRAARRRAQVLPCGVDLERFRPLPRGQARAELGLDADAPLVLFPADPARAEKRHDRALALARATGARLLSLGGVEPERVPLWVNAANAVLVPSEREGFGLAVLEALACDVPVLATPVGVHRDALEGVSGTLCAPFELGRWRAALEPHLRDAESRVAGRVSAERFSAHAMAVRVADAWRTALASRG